MSRIAGRTARLLIGAAVALVIVVGIGVWWFFIRDTAPAEFSSDTPIAAGCAEGTRPSSFDGTWTIARPCESQAGFRITESVASLADHVAVGRSSAVTGTLAVDGTTITEGSFTVDLTELEFTDDPGLPVANRSRALRGRGLETDRFPEATFALTGPLELGAVPADGKTVTVEVAGELTLHGETKATTISVDVTAKGDVVRLVTTDPVDVRLGDYGITPPTGGPVAEVSDTGSFEFDVYLAKQA
jgi:polyisoprenoid-binding protein YceI